MSNCKGCGKEIIWVETSGGRPMPCDPKLITVGGEDHGKLTLVMKNGNVIKNCGIGWSGYVPHWATCRKAVEFKKLQAKKKSLSSLIDPDPLNLEPIK